MMQRLRSLPMINQLRERKNNMIFYDLILVVYTLGLLEKGSYQYSGNRDMVNYLSDKGDIEMRVKYNAVNMNGRYVDEYKIGTKKIYLWSHRAYSLKYESTCQLFEMRVSGDSVFLYTNGYKPPIYDNSSFLVSTPVYMDYQSAPSLSLSFDFIDSLKDGEYQIYSDDLRSIYGDIQSDGVSVVSSRNVCSRNIVDFFTGKEYEKIEENKNIKYDEYDKKYKVVDNGRVIAEGRDFSSFLLLEDWYDPDYSLFLVDKDAGSLSEFCFVKKIFYDGINYFYLDNCKGILLYNQELYVRYDKKYPTERGDYLIVKYSSNGDILGIEKVEIKKTNIFR